jgi:hypothetical protein
VMNPTYDQGQIDKEMAKDEPRARAEYYAEFRNDIEQFLTREAIEACVSPGVLERGPSKDNRYVGFADPAGGGPDAFTMAIAHQDGTDLILDAVRERVKASPEATVAEYAQLLKSYNLTTVTGDNYAGDWPKEAFLRHGIEYIKSDKVRSDLYLATLPLINAQRADLLDIPKIVNQFMALERKTGRQGKDTINHAVNGKDDLVNAIAGALVLANNYVKPMTFNPPFVASMPRGQLGNMDPSGYNGLRIKVTGGPVVAPEPVGEVKFIGDADNPTHARLGDIVWTRGPTESLAAFQHRVAQNVERNIEQAKSRAAAAAANPPEFSNAGFVHWTPPRGRWG